MNKNLVMTILLVVIIGAGAFIAGMKYQESQRSSLTRQFGGQNQRTGVGVNRTGFRPVSGEIISSDNQSITVKLSDGSSKIILLSEKTEINKAASATKEDLKTGEKVAVFGQENSDGSITAQNIQLNPILRNSPGQNPTQ